MGEEKQVPPPPIHTDTRLTFIQWLIPFFWAGAGFYISEALLHVATYQFVHWKLLASETGVKESHAPGIGQPPVLPDPFEDWLTKNTEGWQSMEISLSTIDSISLFFPGLCLILAALPTVLHLYFTHFLHTSSSAKYGKDNSIGWRLANYRTNTLMVYTKCAVCAFFLFAIKGVLGATTTLPDSGGWAICEDRLVNHSPKGTLEWFRGNHTLREFFSPTSPVLTARFCSDMMYSGHTMTVTLAALGLYEIVRIYTVAIDFGQGKHDWKSVWAPRIILGFMYIFAVAEQCIEIYVVEKTRFHYTIDVIVALIMTFLWYTNTVIAVFAKGWSDQEHHRAWLRKWTNQEWFEVKPPSFDNPEGTADWEMLAAFAQRFESSGDVLIPPCCIPFACCNLAGRAHLYYDDEVKELLKMFDHVPSYENPKSSTIMEAHLRVRMNLGDGAERFKIKEVVKSYLTKDKKKETSKVPLLEDVHGMSIFTQCKSKV